MATRHNLCPNPKAKNNVTGWTGGSTPAQSTGLSGFPTGVTTAARYTTGSFLITPTGTASAGVTYTGSLYVREGGTGSTGLGVAVSTLYLAFTRSVGGNDETHTVSVGPYATNTVTRISLTVTAPANTTGIYMILDGNNFSIRPCDVTAVLYEAAGALDTYFDGDTAGASWDGTDGNSSSTLSGGITQAINTATESDTTFTLGRAKRRTLGMVAETDAAFALSRRKSRTLSLATETNSALSLGRAKRRTVGLVLEADAALPITPPVPASVKATSAATVAAQHTSTASVTLQRTSTAATSARATSSGGVT